MARSLAMLTLLEQTMFGLLGLRGLGARFAREDARSFIKNSFYKKSDLSREKLYF